MKSVKFPNCRISPARDNSRRQRGVTLIELMVALVVGLLVLGALIKVYVDMSSMYRFNEGLARVQENGRFALEFIRRDARKAGFWGCKSGFGTTICDQASFFPANVGNVSGADGLSDSISFRGAFDSGTPLEENMESGNGPSIARDPAVNLVVADGSLFAQNDYAVIADCEVADVFSISSVSGTAIDPAPARLGKAYQAEDETGSKYNDVRVWPARETTYCIRTGAGGTPALFRLIKSNTSQSAHTCAANGIEIVEGIENMQILYGVDADASGVDPSANPDGSGGDGIADRYVTWTDLTQTVANGDAYKIVSIRLSLLARSIENNLMTEPAPYTFNGTPTTPTDRYLRKVFTTTITLRNVPRQDPNPDWEANTDTGLAATFNCPT